MKVLVAEDDVGVREGLCELVAEGAEPVPATTLAEAMAALAHDRFALVLTDLTLDGRPDAGWQIADEARKRAMPVVVASGLAPTREKPARAGVHAMLAKPFTIDQVLGLVERFAGLFVEVGRRAAGADLIELASGAEVPASEGIGQEIYVAAGRLVRNGMALERGHIGYLTNAEASEWRAEGPARIARVSLRGP